MTARPPDVTTVYIAAVGGQGGALLTEWLLAAAQQMRYRAHAVGIPGMSQRGGATSYYVEMAPEETAPGLAEALLSPSPFLGEIDCLIGLELLELGRAVEVGYSSERTDIVGSTHRDYTIMEKMPSYAGPQATEQIIALLERFSGRLAIFDAMALARTEGLTDRHVNAILLGAVAAVGALPLREEAYRLAIKAVGVAPDLNLRAFEAGLRHTLAGLPELPEERATTGVLASHDALPASGQRALAALLERVPAEVDDSLRSLLEVACARLIDYQDEPYARQYLERVMSIWEQDPEVPGNGRLTETFARHVANLMAYEDPIRVAALKSDPRRFAHIEAQHGIREAQTYRLSERFRPELEELYGLLPVGFVRRFLPWADEASHGQGVSSRRTFPINISTTSLVGMAILKGLAALKFLRPSSWRGRQQEQLIEAYTQRVISYVAKSYELGCVAAQAGGMIRGYGRVRRRTEHLFHAYFSQFLDTLAALDERLGGGNDYALTRSAVTSVQGVLKPTGAGFEDALALVRALEAHEDDWSYEELLVLASGPLGKTQGSSSSSCCQ